MAETERVFHASKATWCVDGHSHYHPYCIYIHVQVSHSIDFDCIFYTYLYIFVFPNHQLHKNKGISGFAFIYQVSTAQFLLHYRGFWKHVLNLPTCGFLHHFHHRIISLSCVVIYYPGKHCHLPILGQNSTEDLLE